MAGNPPMQGAPANMRSDAMGFGGQNSSQNPKDLLPTFIYDYFIKEREYALAQAILKSNLNVTTNTKTSPKDANGVDDEPKDELSKRLDGLPRPSIPDQTPDSPFLKDWWALFWDLWSAARNRGNNSPTAMQYFQNSTANAKTQSQVRQNMISQGMLSNNAMAMMGLRMGPSNMRNGGMDMRQTAMANSSTRPGMRPSLNQQPGQGQMQREGSDMDLNGQRPQSPMSGGDNEPSPKRPRTDGGPQMGGRPGMAMAGQMPNGIPPSSTTMMQGGFDAAMMGGSPHVGFGGGTAGKQMQMFANMGKAGMQNPGQQGSPMMGPNGDMVGPDAMVPFQQGMARGGGQAGTQGGALADYQMQLMLLEQQNKKRLLMARQEQDVMHSYPGPLGTFAGPGFPGGPFMGNNPAMMTAPGMSPHGSRTGHSPNNDQMKRGTPKMGQSSPLPDGSMPNRASPAPGFDGGMPHSMAGNPMFMNSKMAEAQMGPGGIMRPPNGMPGGFGGPNGPQMTQQLQMEMMARQGARMASGSWPGAPQMPGVMMPGGPQPPQQPQGDNGPRAQMPPPSAPTGNTNNNNNNNNGRTQPTSPQQQGAAPPTPSQPAKPAPKKKDTKDSKKKGGQKKGPTTTGATPKSEAAADPPTPTPLTPIISVHPNSFTGPKGQGGPANAQNPAPSGQQAGGAAPAADATAAAAPFGNIDQSNDMGMGFDFQNTDNSDVLDGFDFDSFLHMDEPMAFNDFDPSQFSMNGDGVDIGAAEQ